MAWQAAFRWRKQLESEQEPFWLRLLWAVKDWAIKDWTEPRDCLGGHPDFRPPSFTWCLPQNSISSRTFPPNFVCVINSPFLPIILTHTSRQPRRARQGFESSLEAAGTKQSCLPEASALKCRQVPVQLTGFPPASLFINNSLIPDQGSQANLLQFQTPNLLPFVHPAFISLSSRRHLQIASVTLCQGLIDRNRIKTLKQPPLQALGQRTQYTVSLTRLSRLPFKEHRACAYDFSMPVHNFLNFQPFDWPIAMDDSIQFAKPEAVPMKRHASSEVPHESSPSPKKK
ncbi:hypothetical protein Landi51_11470 [Colletotrichum acutatum]